MKSENLSFAFNYIDDNFLEEVTAAKHIHENKIKKFRFSAAVAACLAVTITLSSILLKENKSPKNPKNLPIISLSQDPGDYGYEGYIAHDISELVNSNPWNENIKLKTLPVFVNKYAYQESAKPYVRTVEDLIKMKNKLFEVAQSFGINKNDIAISDGSRNRQQLDALIEKYKLINKDLPEDFDIPHQITGKYKNYEITVDYTLRTIINFNPAINLPKEYNFNSNKGFEENKKVAEYLLNRYYRNFNLKLPKININGGDYDINATQLHYIDIFDISGNIKEDIINYNFKSIRFGNDNGKLSGIYINHYDISEKLGNYPIISAEKAKELLLNKKYLTSVPYDIKDESSVKKVELIYRTATWEKYFIPYYRFYVEFEGETEFMKQNNFKTYGAFYVPAIEEKYISNLTEWNSSLN